MELLQLPIHIVEVIFSKLPIFNLPVCRLVCKAWNDVVLNLKSICISKSFLAFAFFFNHGHTAFSRGNPKIHCIDTDNLSSTASFEYNTNDFSITFRNSCNGLLFVSRRNSASCNGILNPMTNEFFELAKVKSKLFEFYRFGFGFSLKTKKYKVFKIIHESNTCTCKTEVFRFGIDNQWRSIPNQMPFVNDRDLNSVYLNGVIYWIVRLKGARDECAIYALDVETERVESIVVLKLGCVPLCLKFEPCNGTIYVIVFLVGGVQVWRMQGKDSWVRDFVVDYNNQGNRSINVRSNLLVKSFHLVKAFEDGRMLIIMDNKYIYLDETGRKIKIAKTLDHNARVIKSTNLSSFNFGSLPNILAGHQ